MSYHLAISYSHKFYCFSPCIVFLDSMGGTHHEGAAVFREYLSKAWALKFSDVKANIFNEFCMPAFHLNVPKQQNLNDCGLFMLENVEQFYKNGAMMDRKEKNWQSLYSQVDMVQNRSQICTVITGLIQKGKYVDTLPGLPFPKPSSIQAFVSSIFMLWFKNNF